MAESLRNVGDFEPGPSPEYIAMLKGEIETEQYAESKGHPSFQSTPFVVIAKFFNRLHSHLNDK